MIIQNQMNRYFKIGFLFFSFLCFSNIIKTVRADSSVNSCKLTNWQYIPRASIVSDMGENQRVPNHVLLPFHKGVYEKGILIFHIDERYSLYKNIYDDSGISLNLGQGKYKLFLSDFFVLSQGFCYSSSLRAPPILCEV